MSAARLTLLVLPSNAHVEARLALAREARLALAREARLALASEAGLGLDDQAGPALTTLARLEGDLARALLPGLRVASTPVVRIALARAIDGSGMARELSAAAGLTADHLVDALDRTLGELHHAGVDPGLLRAAAARAQRRRDSTRGTLLAEVMEGLEVELSRLGLVDARTVASRLGVALAPGHREPEIERAMQSALGDAAAIELRDIASLSPARLAWLEALHARLCNLGAPLHLHPLHAQRGVTLELPTASGDLFGTCGLDDPRELLASRLEERWTRLEAPPTLVHRDAGGVAKGPFARLGGQLFVRSGSRVASDDGAPLPTILRAASIAIAVDAVACRVAAALRRGVPPSRVVIAMPVLDEAIVRPLRTALARLSVPTFEARGAMPAAAPSLARVLHLLRCVDRGPRKEDVVDLLRMGRAIQSPRRHAIARHLEQVAGSDLTQDGEAILARLQPENERDRDRAVLDPIVRLLVSGKSAAAITTRGAALRFVLAIAELSGLSRAFERDATSAIVRAGDAEVVAALGADAAALRAFTTAVDDLSRANELAGASDAPTTLAETIVELEAALEARRLVVGSRAGAVPIVRLRDRFGLDADVLFVMEAHDGALPARASADPLLPRGLVEAIRELDDRRTPPPRALASAVDLLAAIDAIAATQQQVFVVERAIDDDGRAILPGPLSLEIRRLLPDTPVVAERGRIIPGGDVPARRPGDLALFAHRQASARLVAGGAIAGVFPGVEPAAIARASAELSRGRAFAASAIGETGLYGARLTGRLELDDASRARLAARLGGPEAPFPVTAVEALLDCPFVTFAERVLGARRDEALQLDGGARESGKAAHLALLEIYRALRASGLPDGEPAARLARISEIARAEATRVIDPPAAAGPLQRLRRETIVDQVVGLTVADHAEMLLGDRAGRRAFVDGEVGFGGIDPTWPPLVLGAGQPTAVHIQGRIDRFDVSIGPDGRRVATVIDYKARVPEGMTLPTFFEGKGVQLALYARVLSANLEPRPERVEARFFGYKHGRLGGLLGVKSSGKKAPDDTAWRAQVGDAGGDVGEGAVALRVIDAFEQVRAGDVAPRRSVRCERCDQRVACRAPDVVLAETGRE